MHPLNAHKSEQTLGGGEGPGSLALGSPWGRRVGQDSASEQQELIYKVVLVSLYSKVIQLYIYIHSFKIIFLYGLSQDVEYGSLCYAVGPCRLTIVYINIKVRIC